MALQLASLVGAHELGRVDHMLSRVIKYVGNASLLPTIQRLGIERRETEVILVHTMFLRRLRPVIPRMAGRRHVSAS